MTATTFDTLAFSKRLKEAGFSDKQAEAQTEATSQILCEVLSHVEDSAATKRDLKDLELTLTIRMGGMIIAAIGLAPIVVGFYHHFGLI